MHSVVISSRNHSIIDKIETLKNNLISRETGRFWFSPIKNEAREGMTRNQSGNQWTSDLDVHDKWLEIGSSFCPTEVTYLSCLSVCNSFKKYNYSCHFYRSTVVYSRHCTVSTKLSTVERSLLSNRYFY